MRRFAGRTVIVTGSSRGIGKTVAQSFAREGAEVMLVGRSADRLRQNAHAIGAKGGRAWFHVADLSSSSDIEGVIAAAVGRWGKIDVLVNNAGIIEESVPFLDLRQDVWANVIAINLTAYFLLGQGAAREMAKTGGGAIIHMASIDGLASEKGYAAYCSSKAGILGLSRSMAVDLAEVGIRVNAVSPGYVYTEMMDRELSPTKLQYLHEGFERVPMRRWVRADEVAAVCLFLASSDAGAITGSNVVVDGGLTANWYIVETMPE